MIDVASLDGIELFAKLSPTERRAIADTMTARSYEANHTIVWVGDLATEFFVIVSGSVEACLPDESGQEVRVSVMTAGEYFGELALFDGGRRSSSVRSLGPVEVLVLAHDAFHRCLREHPPIAIHALAVLGGRQRNLLERMRGVRNVNDLIERKLTPWQRVAVFIAELAASRGFLIGNALGYGAWIVVNLKIGETGLDPFPFQFLSFFASIEAMFLSLFIIVSQTTEGQRDRLRNEQDYQVAAKVQFEIAQLHLKLDRMAEDCTRGIENRRQTGDGTRPG